MQVVFVHSLVDAAVGAAEDTEYLDPADVVVSVQYVSELDAVTLATAQGNLMTVEVATRAMEIVGAVVGGLSAAVWSPDQELLAIATGTGTLLLMSKDWDMVAEVSLQPAGVPPLGDASISWRGDGM